MLWRMTLKPSDLFHLFWTPTLSLLINLIESITFSKVPTENVLTKYVRIFRKWNLKLTRWLFCGPQTLRCLWLPKLNPSPNFTLLSKKMPQWLLLSSSVSPALKSRFCIWTVLLKTLSILLSLNMLNNKEVFWLVAISNLDKPVLKLSSVIIWLVLVFVLPRWLATIIWVTMMVKTWLKINVSNPKKSQKEVCSTMPLEATQFSIPKVTKTLIMKLWSNMFPSLVILNVLLMNTPARSSWMESTPFLPTTSVKTLYLPSLWWLTWWFWENSSLESRSMVKSLDPSSPIWVSFSKPLSPTTKNSWSTAFTVKERA